MAKASIIIVSYNAEKFIGRCLESVFRSDFKNFEVIVIDNGSKDRSAKIISKYCHCEAKPKQSRGEIVIRMGLLHFVRNDTNLGSCEARNQGARVARGKYLIFFDCDTEVDINCISEYVKAFEKYPDVGAMHGKLLKMDDRKSFDSSGEMFDSFGFLADRGSNDSESVIASGKAASYGIRADLFNKLGGYDPDFFFFVEEPDLDMRVWNCGYKVIFLPSAIVWHAFGTSLKDTKNYYSRYLVRYYGSRNYILMLLKNFSWGRLLIMLPLQILALLSLAILFIVRGKFKDGYYMMKGIFWNVLNLKKILKKRAVVQKMRVVGDENLGFLFEKRPFGYYIKKIGLYMKAV